MKRFCSFCLTFLLAFSPFVPVYGQESVGNGKSEEASSLFTFSEEKAKSQLDTEKGVQNVITELKKTLNLSADYVLTDDEVNEEEVFGKQWTVLDVSWEDEKEGSVAYATYVDGLGLVGYYHYLDQWQGGLGAVKKAEGEKIAKDFLAKVRPDIAQFMEPVSTGQLMLDGVHYYRFQLTVKGIPAPFACADIQVDRHTGKVKSFYCTVVHRSEEFPSSQGVLPLEKGKAAYQEEIGALLNYYSSYDEEGNANGKEAFPLYLTESLKKVVDARTGKAVTLHADLDHIYDEGYAWKSYWDWSGFMGGEVIAWDDEDYDVRGVMTREKAEESIRPLAPELLQGEEAGVYLQQSAYSTETYVWRFWSDKGEAIVDAKTGELIHFTLYSWAFDHDGSWASTDEFLTESQAREKAEAWIKTIAPEKFALVAEKKINSDNQKLEEFLLAQDENSYYLSEYTFTYHRQSNDMDYLCNGIEVRINAYTGRVVFYDCDWDTAVTFSSLEGLLTQDQVFPLFDETGTFGLFYIIAEDGDPRLVYGFTMPVEFGVHGISGEKLGLDGESYWDDRVFYPVYQDISGHRSEEIILELQEYGYYLRGDQFKPNEMITLKDFLAYLHSSLLEGYDETEIEEALEEYVLFNDDQVNLKAKLTKQDAAKYLIEGLDLEYLARNDKAFVNPFSDEVEEGYQGYASLCYILGIMPKDNNGRFNGKQVLTRAEAAELIYRTLEKDSYLDWWY